jgi:hypothetical protein
MEDNYYPSSKRRRGKYQAPPGCTVHAKNISMISGRFLLTTTIANSVKEWNEYEISKYALVDKTHPQNNLDSGTVTLNVSLNEQQYTDQDQPFLPRICFAFSSLEGSS